MPTPLRRRLRLARRGLGYAIAIALVLVAMVLGVASQLLPMAERNPERIAAWLSERAGRTVAFDRVDTEWTRRGPLLQLDNLRIGEGAQAFSLGDTEMLVSLYAGLLPGRAFSELRLRGLDLTLERADDGRWQVRGLPGQQQVDGDPFEALEGLGELQVVDGKLAVIAPSLGIDARLPKVDLRLRVSGDRVRAGVRAWPQLDAVPLDVVLDLDRGSGDGRAYGGADHADLSAWSPLLRLAGVAVASGQGRAEAWAELRDHRLAHVTLETALDNVALRSTAVPDDAADRAQLGHVEGRAHWRMTDAGWRFDAPTLRIHDNERTQVLDGLVVAGGARYAVLAERLDAAPLFVVAALSDRVPPALRHWLRTTHPQATLREIDIRGTRDGAMHASARIEALGFDAVGEALGVQGLAGSFDGDADGFTLQLEPGAPLRIDWPSGFGTAHTLRLGGDVTGWRDGDGWRIGTPGLRIDGDGIGLEARGSLWWQGDGTQPRLELAAAIDETKLPVAKRFLVRHRMSASVVEWLDAALLGGTLQDGRALISGDLDHWPFRDGEGRFEATARMDQGVLRFKPDWPAVEKVDADLRFVADGFEVDGSGELAGIGIRSLQAGIDSYKNGRLHVQARGAGDAAQLLDLLRASPLQRSHADTLDNLSARGAAEVGFRLTLPTQRGSRAQIAGTIELHSAELADARWQLAFDQVTGRTEYTRNGFRAEQLSVRHAGAPGRLSLRAGRDYVTAPGQVFEAELDATLDADGLLKRAPQLAWLEPHLDGRSAWNIAVAIPEARLRGQPTARLQLRSDLVGTALTLPAPLRKPAGDALAATVETPLPLGSGDIRVGLGDRIGVRARTANGRTGVRVVLGANAVDAAPPASGLVATGTAAELDAIGWIALARGGLSDDGDREGDAALPLQRIDIQAQRLHLLGGVFPATRLVVAPAPQGAIAVRASGAVLQGALLVPNGERTTVAGAFERVHWTSVDGAAAGLDTAPGATAAATSGATKTADASSTPDSTKLPTVDDLDPARIPALSFDVADLRIGDAHLGVAKFRSRPGPGGLRVEQLQMRAEKQAIDVTGEWNGRGAAARTRMTATVDSDDLGALLKGFGFADRLDGGNGNLLFDMAWPGSPAAFALDSLDGDLTLEVRDGHLLEVEPGAGRVLGLLSIAELPRRLTLDFGDFFAKGFAFNRIGGTVRFGAGTARSDGLVIDGPAAAIDIRGSANLRAQTFDQMIEVRPKAGNLLTAVGAIAGGPVGAALGAAANAVLEKPLGQIAAKTYKVTGPWKEPKVEVISRAQSRVSVMAQEPPAG